MISSSRAYTGTDTQPQDFDLEDLLHLEQRFYTVGYEEGYAHGRLHGLIEGRALGTEKGFELWEELGFYEGVARLWTAVSSDDPNTADACNPRSDEEDEGGVDMSAQLRLIRSRYKVMCAALGVRARLQPAPSAGARVHAEDGAGTSERQKGSSASNWQHTQVIVCACRCMWWYQNK
ncbi:hypothetical protein F5148DRAFT_1277688 [Russula earlei]|uniref:Uncharacterized protein n=1 Tax=Russula earlei TaxID=71964 RepID=A0ACC0TXB2_9AGAM|nr:hypothetical protein F5148DRAFT_1277688 [Russula earlei]